MNILKTAKKAGILKRDFFESHGVRLADALIAATSVIQKVDLKL